MKFLLKHSFWLAPVLAFVGFVSYFTFFARFPALRDVPWINVPMVILAALLGAAGLALTWKSAGWRRRLLHLGGVFVSAVIAALLCFYVYSLSYQIPELNETTESLEEAPDFSLSDANGKLVSLSDYRGKKVVISFYRGFW